MAIKIRTAEKKHTHLYLYTLKREIKKASFAFKYRRNRGNAMNEVKKKNINGNENDTIGLFHVHTSCHNVYGHNN